MKTKPVAWEPVSAGEYAQAMGQHAASVCVITTAIGDERYGLTATAVTSVSAQPPRLLVCINRSSFTHAKIVEAGAFCVNVSPRRKTSSPKPSRECSEPA